MAKIKEILNILINIRYKFSMNKFEETYGESISYSRIEQESYIELKDMVVNELERKVKFRKHERVGMILIVRAELTDKEFKKVIELNNKNSFPFFSNFIISKMEVLKNK